MQLLRNCLFQNEECKVSILILKLCEHIQLLNEDNSFFYFEVIFKLAKFKFDNNGKK